ncbi:MAG: DMT family transporter [Alphaproteobacteria bacterium]|nr:DMT family transporter [Alphaproteobacteria bacterium]
MSRPAAARPDAPLRGIAFLIVGIAIFSLQDVIIRWLRGAMPIPEFVFLRTSFSLLPLGLLIWWEGGVRILRTRRLGLQLARGLLLLLSYHAYFVSVLMLPLADAVALFFSAPLFVTLFSIVLLRERVDARHWATLLLGFAGIVLMVRPDSGSINAGIVFALASTLIYALISTLTRWLGATEGATSMVAYMSVVYLSGSAVLGLALPGMLPTEGLPAGFDHLAGQWITPAAADLALLALCGLVAIVGFYCLVQAYRLAPASTVAPFEYSGIVWGVVWGYSLWREVPDGVTMTGIAIVVTSGITILRRERQARQREAP